MVQKAIINNFTDTLLNHLINWAKELAKCSLQLDLNKTYLFDSATKQETGTSLYKFVTHRMDVKKINLVSAENTSHVFLPLVICFSFI